jgi:hypothetical protein
MHEQKIAIEDRGKQIIQIPAAGGKKIYTMSILHLKDIIARSAVYSKWKVCNDTTALSLLTRSCSN